MTRALRTAHRRVVLGLGLVVPLGLGAALAARPEAPRNPTAFPGDGPSSAGRDAEGGPPVRLDADGLRVELRPERPFGREPFATVRASASTGAPEVVLYASDDEQGAASDDALPAGARLLGIVPFGRTERVALATPGGPVPRAILAYDVAHGRVVARAGLGAGAAHEGGVP